MRQEIRDEENRIESAKVQHQVTDQLEYRQRDDRENSEIHDLRQDKLHVESMIARQVGIEQQHQKLQDIQNIKLKHLAAEGLQTKQKLLDLKEETLIQEQGIQDYKQ